MGSCAFVDGVPEAVGVFVCAVYVCVGGDSVGVAVSQEGDVDWCGAEFVGCGVLLFDGDFGDGVEATGGGVSGVDCVDAEYFVSGAWFFSALAGELLSGVMGGLGLVI